MEGAGDDGILQYFKEGAAIEIKIDDDGFRGSWYEGTVLGAPEDLSSSVLVMYTTLAENHKGKRALREPLNLVQLRPSPPQENRPSFKINDEVDAYYYDGWWVGKITQTFRGKYLVHFPLWKEQLPFTASQLRLHRDWINEEWVLPSKNKTPSPSKAVIEHNFNKGDRVEARSDDDGFQGLFEEEVDGLRLRPRPPDGEVPGRLKYNEKVDAFLNDGWWEGKITQTLEEADRYQVLLDMTKEHLSFTSSLLRPHRDWVNERWVPPLDPSSSYNADQFYPEVEAVTEHNFNSGDHVEAMINEDAFYGAWFPAIVLEETEADNYMIVYKPMMNDDGTSLLRKETDGLYLRPSPPDVGVTDRFQVNEKVDAPYNDGWWVGTITKVQRRGRYFVYFETPDKELMYYHSQLRVHQEWINGEWHIAAKCRIPSLHSGLSCAKSVNALTLCFIFTGIIFSRQCHQWNLNLLLPCISLP
ncbi:protein AGENET DOMAIN (AGD)-CONTAINING P1-like isoform X2 [Salvia hispanica]|uniref:protein AGENET DOMAIN (AGD)-CONTAINING P1-like isoform X2 n=1 Tax=Salvia hispanica TaxID=49212 RepID=UPI0020098987|nr:protein AGENET DOMAIN (AGD)-CONTAINING P1-like isoform X2 [Salvia hispanica]